MNFAIGVAVLLVVAGLGAAVARLLGWSAEANGLTDEEEEEWWWSMR